MLGTTQRSQGTELPFQPIPRAVQSHADDIRWNAHDGRDFLGREAIPRRERQDLPIPLGQEGKGGANRFETPVIDGRLNDARGTQLIGKTFHQPATGMTPSGALQEQIARNAEEPEPCLVSAWNSLELSPRDEVSLGEDIGRVVGRLRPAQHVREEVGARAAKQLLEGNAGVILRLPHERALARNRSYSRANSFRESDPHSGWVASWSRHCGSLVEHLSP